MRTRPPILVWSGVVLLALGAYAGTRPVSFTQEFDPVERRVNTQYTCGSTFRPRHCDPTDSALVWCTGALVVGGLALVAAGAARWWTGRRDPRDRWSTEDALLFVGAPVLVVGGLVTVASYLFFVTRWFPRG